MVKLISTIYIYERRREGGRIIQYIPQKSRDDYV
jgi:hypothetical protein